MTRRRAPEFRLRCAAEAARKLLDRHRILHPADLRLEDIAWVEGAEIRYGSLDGAAARLVVRSSGRAVIRLAERSGEGGRARFSIAHELGHLLLHRADLVELCAEGDLAIETNKPMEGEANAFATELLMPKVFIERYVNDEISLDAVRKVADVFDVSMTASALRVVTFTPTPGAVAVTGANRVVRWIWGNEAFPWRLRERGIPGHEESLAVRALRGLTRQDADTVPPEAWIDEDELDEDVEFVEQIVRMPRWGQVLSVIGGVSTA